MKVQIAVSGFKIACIIGVHPWEREKAQDIVVDLELHVESGKKDRIEETVNYDEVVEVCHTLVVNRKFHLLETCALEMLEALYARFPLKGAKVKVSKPGAIKGAQNVSVEVMR